MWTTRIPLVLLGLLLATVLCADACYEKIQADYSTKTYRSSDKYGITSCQLTFWAPHYKRAKIEVTVDSDCSGERVKVYEGVTSYSDVLYNICGQKTVTTLSNGRGILVSFTGFNPDKDRLTINYIIVDDEDSSSFTDDDGLNGGQIFGICLAPIAVIMLAVVGIIFWNRNNKKMRRHLEANGYTMNDVTLARMALINHSRENYRTHGVPLPYINQAVKRWMRECPVSQNHTDPLMARMQVHMDFFASQRRPVNGEQYAMNTTTASVPLSQPPHHHYYQQQQQQEGPPAPMPTAPPSAQTNSFWDPSDPNTGSNYNKQEAAPPPSYEDAVTGGNQDVPYK